LLEYQHNNNELNLKKNELNKSKAKIEKQVKWF